MRRRPLAALTLLGLSLAASPQRAEARREEPGRLATLPEESARRPVLGGRLTLQAPLIATESPGPSRSDETRLEIEAGEERVELRIAELFAMAPDAPGGAMAVSTSAGPARTLGDAVRRVVATWEAPIPAYRIDEVVLASGMPAVVVTPVESRATPTSTFLRAMFVRSPDGTVQFIEARANAAAFRVATHADAIAARVLHTVAPGSRALLPLPQSYRLTTPLPGISIFAEAPEGFAGSVERDQGRVVHRFRTIAALGETVPMVTVTFARDAIYQHERLGRDVRRSFREGKVFGEKALWHSWTATKDGAAKEHLEALVTLGDAEQPLVAHVLVLHRGAAQADELRAFVESMRVERRPGG